MAYLDVSPMITALRTQSSDFELSRGWLKHAPSRHRFRFDKYGNVTIDAHCDCASLSVAPEQSRELWQEFQVWREVYSASGRDQPGIRIALQGAQCVPEDSATHQSGLAPRDARSHSRERPGDPERRNGADAEQDFRSGRMIELGQKSPRSSKSAMIVTSVGVAARRRQVPRAGATDAGN